MKTMRNQEVMGLDMAKCLMLLSCRLDTKFKKYSSSPNHVYECKTCNRQFSSFQALGGHRASHKKPRTLLGGDDDLKSDSKLAQGKPKKHECSICGLEFSLGQALGGHMRRHRMMNAGFASSAPSAVDVASKIPVLMRSNSKRVMCLDMDLNLTPLENDLKVLFGNMASKVDTLRTREEVVGVDMDKVLMLLSYRLETKFKRCSSSPNDVFECKTCNRKFPSFQALGGHRASHKKPRSTIMDTDQDPKSETKLMQSKLKKHECSICGLVFSSGQALGGHMRRHSIVNSRFSATIPASSASKMKTPVLMRSNSKRVMCLDMDLNLTPLENDLKLLFGNRAPKVDTLFS
ncbi:hypothetical protein ACLB2K_065517 [Fragaria x ananassa]